MATFFFYNFHTCFFLSVLKNTQHTSHICAVAILELKKWGATAGPRKNRGANINVYLAWWFFVVLKMKLLWLTLSNPT